MADSATVSAIFLHKKIEEFSSSIFRGEFLNTPFAYFLKDDISGSPYNFSYSSPIRQAKLDMYSKPREL